MTIHFIATTLAGGGAERVMVLLANEFASRNHRVSIITFNPGESYPLDKRVNLVQLHQGRLKNHTFRSITNLFNYYRKKQKPTVAISIMPRINFVSIVVCRLLGVKIIACEHNNHLRTTSSVTKIIWRHFYKHAHALTVLTQFDKPFFEKKGAKVVVMPNPCTFPPLNSFEANRAKVILAVGGLDRIYHKGFDNLIELAEPILKRHPDWTLKIVGGGDEGLRILTKLASDKGVLNQVVFTGFRNNVNEIMRESAIFVLSSRYEGLPMVLLEAMSQGMACIAYDCKTGPSDIINHMENGILVDDQNMDAMQDNLEKLISDSELRSRLGKQGIKSLDRYSMENVISKWNSLFSEILEVP